MTNYLKLFIPTLLLTGLFGYIGYVYNKDNNGDIVKGIIFGSIYPLVSLILKIIKEINISSWNAFPYIIYTIIWICIADSIPIWIGFTILSTIDMMCEDCFMDVHLDEDGNYHDEEIGY